MRERVGSTRDLVAAGGFREARGVRFLAGADGTARFFLELAADPDRPEFRPREAWEALLAALPPGWGIRALRVVWPDPVPRRAFREGLLGWSERDGWLADLIAFLEADPPPLRRRTILEIAVPPAALPEAPGFLDGVAAMLAGYGIQAVRLREDEVRDLARRLLHPRWEG